MKRKPSSIIGKASHRTALLLAPLLLVLAHPADCDESKRDDASELTSPNNAQTKTTLVVIPSGIKIGIIFGFGCEALRDGEEFSVHTTEDTMADGRVAIPANTRIQGKVLSSKLPSNYASRAVVLRFEEICLQNNHQIPLVAKLMAWGGAIKVHRGSDRVDIPVRTIAPASGAALGTSISQCSPITVKRRMVQNKSSNNGKLEAALRCAFNLPDGDIAFIAKGDQNIGILPGDITRIELEKDLRLPVPLSN